MNGRPFTSFDAFRKSSNGLGQERREIERRLTGQELAADPGVEPLAKHGGENQRGRDGRYTGEGTEVVKATSVGRGAEYYVRRLKRDRPDIAEALARGEYPSAKAAARAAGIKWARPEAPLTLARRAWWHLSAEERATFLAEIGAAFRP